MSFSYWILLSAVAPVFVLVLAGFAIRRAGWLSAEADASLLSVTVNFLYPALIADTILGNPALQQLGNLTWAPLVGFITCLLGFGVCGIGARLLGLARGPDARTFCFGAGLYNYGYTAIPIVQALFNKATMGVLFTHNLGVEIAFWIGASMILAGASPRRDWRKILTVPVITVLFSVALNFIHLHDWLPQFVLASTHSLGQCAVPLALLLTGATFADFVTELHPRGGWKVSAGACLLRLGVLPLFFLALAKWLPCSLELKHVIVVQAAMPAAMLPVILAKHYHGNPKIALQIVLSTTIVSIATIPLWIRWGLALVGV